MLTNGDEQELRSLSGLLMLLQQAPLAVQSTADEGHHGTLREQLATFHWLLGSLSSLKPKHATLPDTQLTACVKPGWKNLDKYYGLGNDAPANSFAISLLPHFKHGSSEYHWLTHPQWIEAVKKGIVRGYC